MNRRLFLKNASLASLGAWMNVSCGKKSEAKTVVTPKHLGLQLFGVSAELANDVPAGLRRIKEIGYDTLELAGYRDGAIALFHDPIPLSDYHHMAEDAGLQIVSSHVRTPQQAYIKDNKEEVLDFWKSAVNQHLMLGINYLVQANIPACRSVEEAQFVAEVFNEAGKIAESAGMQWTLHNEANVFMRVMPSGKESMYQLNGRYPEGARQIYDVLLENTHPDYVCFELDCFAAVSGGNDPLQYLQQYPSRMRLMHVKDREALGQSGMINYENIFRQFYANGMKDFFVEDENFMSGHQFERVAESAKFLQEAVYV